ncbi:glutathione-dependent disulfide-bond oxidoreductase [Ignavigranum ruoffiae]|uniref:glutathione-dependent disulfide-bond oxidoreductase n=1 Tax=Ignavigranum ruoffiae TaxID=89093 RepID=UPI003B00E6EC
MEAYKVPKVWQWEDENSKRSGNRPTAGKRFEQTLPQGDHDYQVYSLGTPNGIKVTIMLEELKALGFAVDYDLFLINIQEGDQFGSDFVELNPNSKIPALLDTSEEPAIRVFESGSILLYLADKYQALIPQEWAGRTECLNWVFWQVGAGPFIGGGFGHFFTYASTKQKYPIDRYAMETKRLLSVLEGELAHQPYLCGNDYSIADIINWSWFGRLALDKIYPGSYEFLSLTDYPNVKAWAERINQRPAVQAGLAVEYQSIDAE